MIIPYTRVDTLGTIERQTGVEDAALGVGILGRSGSGGNGAALALTKILLNNKNKGGTGIDSLLGLASGINQEQLAAVGEMGKKPREAQIEAQEMERCGPTRRIHLG